MTRQRNDTKVIKDVLENLRHDYGQLRDVIASIQRQGKAIGQYIESIETPFSHWLRQEPELHPKVSSLSIHNVDWIIHQYRCAEDAIGSRTVNNLMLIEEKRFGATQTDAQCDTLLQLDQALRSKQNRHNGAYPGVPVKTLWGDTVRLKYYGLHCLTFSHSGPLDSTAIWWDKTEITVEMLIKILRFELNPRTLLQRDNRRHHKAKEMPLFVSESGSA